MGGQADVACVLDRGYAGTVPARRRSIPQSQENKTICIMFIELRRYDRALAPPVTMSAINRPHYDAPAGVDWP